MELKGKNVVVTGARRGIGLAIVKAFANEGANIWACARQPDEDFEKALHQLEQEYGGWAKPVYFDLRSEHEVKAAIQGISKEKLPIDVLVNNAGGYPKEIYNNIEHQAIKIWEWSEEQWDQIIKTNLRIPFLCINKVVPEMIKQHSGKIVSVSSRMGRIASQMGAYAVAKAGIVTMTKTTAIQTKEHGIQCNAVAPGIVDTPGQRVYNHSVGQDGVAMGNAEDVAKAIVYLLTDAPFVMTGQVIDLFTTV